MNSSSDSPRQLEPSVPLFDPEPHETSVTELRFNPKDRESVERYRLALERRLGRNRPLAIVGGSSHTSRAWWRRFWALAA